jgi:predicted transcriptional regulator
VKTLAKKKAVLRTTIPIGDINNVMVNGVNALGTLEADVMEVVWRLGRPVTVAEVHEAMRKRGRGKTRAYTTVLTTMRRLADKGILTQDRSSVAFVYTAEISRVSYEKGIVEAVMDALWSTHSSIVTAYVMNKLASGEVPKVPLVETEDAPKEAMGEPASPVPAISNNGHFPRGPQ